MIYRQFIYNELIIYSNFIVNQINGIIFFSDESDVDLKFQDLCRLCASYDNVKISLFGDEGKRRQLRRKIQSCLPFKVCSEFILQIEVMASVTCNSVILRSGR